MAHVLPTFLHFEKSISLLPQISGTCCWAPWVFFIILSRNPQGNFVQRLGAPSPPEVQLLRQVRSRKASQKKSHKPKHKDFFWLPTPHPRTVLFEVAFFWGGCLEDSKIRNRFGSGFPSPTVIRQSLPDC